MESGCLAVFHCVTLGGLCRAPAAHAYDCLLTCSVYMHAVELPTQVVGGYLAYVGYFCFAAGISLACGVEARATLTLINPLASVRAASQHPQKRKDDLL